MENVNATQLAQLLSQGNKVLVQYTATWCGPCKALTPRLANLSNKYSDITFVKVDIEENMDSARELNISTVPTVMIYNGTTLVNRSVGANIDSVYSNILDTL
jgi:thioredoxin 1